MKKPVCEKVPESQLQMTSKALRKQSAEEVWRVKGGKEHSSQLHEQENGKQVQHGMWKALKSKPIKHC